MSATADTSLDRERYEAWRTMTPPEAICGRCDAQPAGEGAQTAIDPDRGLIVACAGCLEEIARERARLARVAARRQRR